MQTNASAIDDWTKNHPVLSRGPDDRIDEASVGAACELERLDHGRVQVVDGGAGILVWQAKHLPLQVGRARPLHWSVDPDSYVAPSRAAERQGCNSLVFAIESADGTWQGILQGALPLRFSGASPELDGAISQHQ